MNTISFIPMYLNINKNDLKFNKLIFCRVNDKSTETSQAYKALDKRIARLLNDLWIE